jgi:YbbR domain-containing protein
MSVKRLLKILSNNWGFKILALALAIVIWLVIVNIEDPEKSRVMTVPVSVENEQYLTDQGYSYEIDGRSEVSFTVSGARTIIEDLSESDFKATADLSEINEDMDSVPIQITVTRFNSGLTLQKRTQYLDVKVEKIISKDFEIQVEEKGTAPENRNVSIVSVNPLTVTVTGPESIVSPITEAKVTIDISGSNDDFSRNGEITLWDESGKQVEDSQITLSDRQTTVQFSVDARKDVALTAKTSGTPEEGYQVTAIECTPEKTTVAGPDDALSALTGIELTSDDLDVTDKNESFEVELPITNALPSGIILAEGAPSKTMVKVTIEPYITKELTISTGQITVKGLEDGYSLTFDDDEVDIVLKGREEDITDIEAEDVTGFVDVSSLKSGNQSVTLQLDGDLTLDSNVTVPVTIRRH